LNPLKKLFKQTFVYGLATVLPRMFSFILVPLYTSVMAPGVYGKVSVIFAWFAIFNVVLAYGMETAFFRFYNTSKEKNSVVATSLISILATTAIFVVLAILFFGPFSQLLEIDKKYLGYVVAILALDALVVIPFAWLRANEKPMRYAILKIVNVVINLGFNIFFLVLLPQVASDSKEGFLSAIYQPNFQISYIFISNVIASGITLLFTSSLYRKTKWEFNSVLWKTMMQYALPVMLSGIAFSINEVFDRILLEKLLPEEVSQAQVGMYAACYKIALFMTLFATAFRMGIEPFFFSHSTSENPQKAYAQITNYFVILGSVILLAVVVYANVLKVIIVRDPAYWEAMPIVPIIVLASFFLGIYHNLSVWYKVTDRTKFGAYISAIGAILTIVINIVFIKYFGFMASAVATLIAYGTMMGLSFYFGSMYYPIPYNFRKIGFYLLVSISFSAISFYGFNSNLIIGNLLLALFLGLLYKLEYNNLRKVFIKNGNKNN